MRGCLKGAPNVPRLKVRTGGNRISRSTPTVGAKPLFHGVIIEEQLGDPMRAASLLQVITHPAPCEKVGGAAISHPSTSRVCALAQRPSLSSASQQAQELVVKTDRRILTPSCKSISERFASLSAIRFASLTRQS